ncbi:Membrane alanine aminopeptidase N [hydrothermal vent metagenome]|uniref:Membrane alanine aminopeptidase N n=1 Tax=hydrothermal vent metagenome TaxID=652676 RepID=A0A3B0YJX2_9ZZZZ
MVDLAKDGAPTTPRTISLADYQPPAFLVETVELRFDLEPDATRVFCRITVDRNPACGDHSGELLLHGKELELLSLSVDGVARDSSSWQIVDETLTLSDVPAHAIVEIKTLIHPQSNTALEGLYVSSNMFCTQCEAEGFRRITWFPDRPDVMARYSTTLTADKAKYPVLLSNGNPVKQGELDDGRHWVTWEDPFPKPSYLFALVAGDLACIEGSFTTRSGREIELHIYVEHENRGKCEHAMASIKQAMRWDEDTYGREYDLDRFMIVAVNDFNMGAMENKGLNIFNSSCVLASPETATDADYYNIQGIIGHEYFHNWSGNRVTCRDWFQLSLKEGFTVFRDQEFSADLNSRPVKRIDDVNVLRAHQFAQDAGPMAHPIRPDSYIEISNFYTVTVYNKGAEVVRMIRTLLGAERFRSACDLYFERHDGQAVTTEDFVAAMQDASGVNLTQFKHWYSQAGTPVIEVSGHYDAQQQQYQLTLRQHCPPSPGQTDKKPFHIPVLTALLAADGTSLPLQLRNEPAKAEQRQEILLELYEKEQSFIFTGVKEKPVPSLLRGFSAPVRLAMPHDPQRLTFLFANDSDPFNRWDAGQTLAIGVLLDLIKSVQNQQPLSLDNAVIEAFRTTLNDPKLDLALIAQALNLPSEAYLADQCESVDVDAVHTARMFFRKTLSKQLYSDFVARYRSLQSDAPYHFDAESMAQRSLKNLCLSWMMETESRQACELCMQQFKQGNCMTDTLAALGTLAQHDLPECHSALDTFYTQWQHDPQVVDKWFAIQAGSRLPGTLERVIDLMEHPAFTLSNPNKIRALVGRFCQGNPVRFHAADGSGYRFLAERVLELDSMNPQIAARLVSALSRWKRFDATRQQHMTQQLERIQSCEALSKDVFEIVSKSLDQG